MTKLELAWIAGFYEGEGSCGAYRKVCYARGKRYVYPHGSLRITIAQKDKMILDWVRQKFGYGTVNFQRSGFGKGVWIWTAWYTNARTTMRALRPYLRIKRRQRDFDRLMEAKA